MVARSQFDAVPESVPVARRFVEEQLDGCPSGPLELVLLLTSEVATNAVVHARTPFTVEVGRSDRTVRVSVSDRSGFLPVQLSAMPADEHGRGMGLVAALSTDWGIEHRDVGKGVWFEVAS